MNIALIFDMDGTMVDNMMVHHEAWQRRLAQAGLHMTIEEVMASCHGRNDETIQRLFGDKYTKEERYQMSFEKELAYREIFVDRLSLIDGLHEFLESAHSQQVPMGIGTAANVENVDFVLDNLQIRALFKSVLCEKDVVKGKPDPEVFLKVAANLSVAPENCLVFEDSPTGAAAAERAGMKSVILTTTHHKEEFSRFSNIAAFRKDYVGFTLADAVKLLGK